MDRVECTLQNKIMQHSKYILKSSLCFYHKNFVYNKILRVLINIIFNDFHCFWTSMMFLQPFICFITVLSENMFSKINNLFFKIVILVDKFQRMYIRN